MSPFQSKPLASLILAASFVLPPTVAQVNPGPGEQPCAKGALHMIAARGSDQNEPYFTAQGNLMNITSAIIQQIPGSTAQGVDYPDTSANYYNSEHNGTEAMLADIKAYVGRCPNVPISLIGYSQGAQLTLDALCGTSEEGFTSTTALASDLGSHIQSVVVMGDISRVPNQPYNMGQANAVGQFPRQDPQGCAAYYSKMVSYCTPNDYYCDANSADRNGTVHADEPMDNFQATVNFVVGKFKAAQ